MKKYAAVVLCAFRLLLIVLVAAGLGITRMGFAGSPAPAEPAAVPGTELHDNVAYIKPGYSFVNRGDAVDVVPNGGAVKTGTYTCSCHSKYAGKCEMVFTTKRITCRSGSCVGGRCLLTAALAPGARR